MKQRSSFVIIGIIVAIVLGFGVIAGIGVGLRSITGLGYEPNVWKAQITSPNSATLAISTFPDGHVCHANASAPELDWVTYCPSTSFEVPPNSTITVVISNYDSSTPLINDFFRQVQGTIGSVELVNNKPVSEVDASSIAHTFDLQSPPNSAYPLYISAPLVGVADDAPTPMTIAGNSYAKPNVISFQFRTGPSGTYIWHCYDPCGADRKPPFGFSGAMSTTGYMAGTMNVASY